jgi:DNA-binding NarL/FixJ family response regulator
MVAIAKSVLSDAGGQGAQSAALRLLMVEDSSSDACLISDELNEALGEQLCLVHVGSLNAALTLLGEQSFDIVITDLNLPDSVGAETFRWLHNAAPNVPIIVLTMERESALVSELFTLGAQD